MESRLDTRLAVGSYEVHREENFKYTGIAYLFGNDTQSLPKVEFDLKFMKNSLKRLQFKVKTFENLDKSDMKQEIAEIENDEDLNKYTCFLFYFSGHGSNGKICGSDHEGSLKILKHVITPIGSYNSLANKPKLFLFDCCRTAEQSDIREYHPLPADVYVAYATSQGQFAYDGYWTRFLAEAILESSYDYSDRWISSVQHILTFARVMTFREHQHLAVSGEDTLMKHLFFRDFAIRPEDERLNEQLHEHWLRRDDLKRRGLQCNICGERINYKDGYFSCDADCEYFVCRACIVQNFDACNSNTTKRSYESSIEKHKQLIEECTARRG